MFTGVRTLCSAFWVCSLQSTEVEMELMLCARGIWKTLPRSQLCPSCYKSLSCGLKGCLLGGIVGNCIVNQINLVALCVCGQGNEFADHLKQENANWCELRGSIIQCQDIWQNGSPLGRSICYHRKESRSFPSPLRESKNESSRFLGVDGCWKELSFL